MTVKIKRRKRRLNRDDIQPPKPQDFTKGMNLACGGCLGVAFAIFLAIVGFIVLMGGLFG